MKYKISFIYYCNTAKRKSLENKNLFINIDEMTNSYGYQIFDMNLRVFKSTQHSGFIGICMLSSNEIILYLKKAE
jgi:hypothetical protein